MTVQIEKLSDAGVGIARIDGFVVFVPNVCSEDIVKIKTLKDNGFSCRQIQEQMQEYSFYQIKHGSAFSSSPHPGPLLAHPKESNHCLFPIPYINQASVTHHQINHGDFVTHSFPNQITVLNPVSPQSTLP